MRVTDLRLPFAASYLGEATGEPAIVLPGGPCRGVEYLGDLAGLGDSRALVVLHPRGTPRIPGLSRGWWTDADDVITLADALDLSQVDLIAHSAGTRLALAVATRYPGRVRSMVLVTPPASWLTGTASDVRDVAASRSESVVHEALASLDEDDPDTDESFKEVFLRQAPARYARWTPATEAHAQTGAISLAAASAWFVDIPEDAVMQIRDSDLPPTLVVGGDQDLLTGVRPVIDYAAALRAELSLLADCGHYPWVEEPAEFRRIVDAWLASPTTRGDV